jgi:glycosyltransferase involved in cell wall biosynthesis
MDITLSSLRSQTVDNFEVLIADNASTDDSVDVIKKHQNNGLPIQYVVNPTNIGFSGNLDIVGNLAKASWMIMLSSDDVVSSNALEVYNKFISLIGEEKKYAFCSTFEKIDGAGKFIEYLSPAQSSVWAKTDIDAALTKQMGFDVYKVNAAEMLKRCLTRFLNPFNFASTCYPRKVYEKVGGYGCGRLYNPDKWFHWKIMVEMEDVYFLDNPLFQYRWHNNNQASQQQRNLVLKYWIDEYRNSFEIDGKMLYKASLTESDVQDAFIIRCIIPNAYLYAKSNDYFMAKRILHFGQACYPRYCNNVIFVVFHIVLSIPGLNWLTFVILRRIRKTKYEFIKK